MLTSGIESYQKHAVVIAAIPTPHPPPLLPPPEPTFIEDNVDPCSDILFFSMAVLQTRRKKRLFMIEIRLDAGDEMHETRGSKCSHLRCDWAEPDGVDEVYEA